MDDGDHYVDGLAEVRKFFAGVAMTIMVRERSDVDFVDLKGKTINDFYMENLDLPEDDPGNLRVVRMLDLVAQLQGFENLREGTPMPFQMAFHLGRLEVRAFGREKSIARNQWSDGLGDVGTSMCKEVS